MKLDKIILENFLTYEYLEYEFGNKPVLVQGLNLTDEGQKSNGSGKSGMQTGIEFCITAGNSRDVRDKELVSFGFDSAKAQLFVSCDVRSENLHIDWTIKIKGSNKLTLKKKKFDSEQWEEVSFSNVNDGKKYILQWFDISKEDLFNYFIINKVRFKSFFKSSNKEKVELINRFSDASIIDGIEDVEISELQELYDNAQRNIAKMEGKIENIDESILREKSRDLAKELEERLEEIKEDNFDIDEEIDEIKSEIKQKKTLISQKKGDIKSFEEELFLFKDQEKTLSLKIVSYQPEIDKVNKKLQESQSLVDSFTKTDWEKEREAFYFEIDDIESDIVKKEQYLTKVREDKNKIQKVLSTIENSLSGIITCPSCSHEFLLNNSDSVEVLKSKKSQVEGLLENNLKLKTKTEREIESLNLNIDNPTKELSKVSKRESEELNILNELIDNVGKINKLISEKNVEINKVKDQLIDKKAQISDSNESVSLIELSIKEIQQEIKDLRSDIDNYEKEKKTNLLLIKNSGVESNEDRIRELESERQKNFKEKEEFEKDVQSIGDKIYKRNQWINNFKQFKMHLANQSLETIQYHCNRYLTGLNSDLRVRFDGYKVLANGNIKDEITATILRDGVERSFSSFSGGEMGRLLFASILANRHMINKTHKYGGLDFLSVDEVFEGVDSVGLKSLLDEAKQLQICIMLITHVTDEEVNEDIVLIVKENGVSKIKDNG